MSRIDQLTDRIERLLLRHEELHRINALLTEQVTTLTQERDSLRARLAAARARIDVLIDKLPQLGAADAPSADASPGASAAHGAPLSAPGSAFAPIGARPGSELTPDPNEDAGTP